MADLNGYDDFFDSRDVLERIKELEEKMEDNPHCEDCEDFEYNVEALADEEREDWEALTALRDEVSREDFEDGITFIREDYFSTYAEELAYDIGAISRAAEWPANHIDWDAAAEELMMDYMTVEFFGGTYFYRA